VVNSIIVIRFFSLFTFFLVILSSNLWSEDNLTSLLSRLEYDQEIKGLFVPKGYFKNRDSIFIGSARIIPSAAKLYTLGWRPALQMESVRYEGSTKDFLKLATNLARNSRTDLYFRRLKTTDTQEETNCFISKSGKVVPES